jgi:hypothetical protein
MGHSSRSQGSCQKSVVTVLSSDGSIQHTESYVITDSVELTRFQVAKVQPPQRLSLHREDVEPFQVDSDHLRRTMVKIRPPRVVCEDSDRVVSGRFTALTVSGGAVVKTKRIMQDLHLPIDVQNPLQATEMISSAGHSWEDNGVPMSLSFLLTDGK